MLRLRFHGRGGQGMKTASRIVGTAAFWQGRYAQDSPLYGAERRGAPMIAVTRIADEPILERGLISTPDIVIVADETLLNDPQVRPLQGLAASGSVLINTTSAPTDLRQYMGFAGRLAILDGTALALAHAGSVAALSVILGAATCKLAELSLAAVEYATGEELQALGLDRSHIEQNLDLARLAYEQVQIMPPATPASRPTAAGVPSPQAKVVTPVYQGAVQGTPSVLAPANTPLRKTGNWRLWRPEIDLSHCTRCWMCFVSCPDGAIALDAQDYPHVDYDVCKGCLICVEECPTGTIHRVREAEA